MRIARDLAQLAEFRRQKEADEASETPPQEETPGLTARPVQRTSAPSIDELVRGFSGLSSKSLIPSSEADRF
jgi:hypothetical protein